MSRQPIAEEKGPTISTDSRRDWLGMPLVPGVNVDPVDVAAGMALAARFGWDSERDQMLVEFVLMRHRRGEEAAAQRQALDYGINLTSWYAILAAAITGASAHARSVMEG